ncbi:hypothetical protein [Archangium lansingense]|uniref:Lipoprotein n=1 Tax=Archangium lansingense TaxID=2995310 RepID=A0ABT4AMY9_9BACT|nr:hypothetical protein [Archangium lansinium]MCY1083020.1 hypothetical protein [Archangium lansinium]
MKRSSGLARAASSTMTESKTSCSSLSAAMPVLADCWQVEASTTV